MELSQLDAREGQLKGVWPQYRKGWSLNLGRGQSTVVLGGGSRVESKSIWKTGKGFLMLWHSFEDGLRGYCQYTLQLYLELDSSHSSTDQKDVPPVHWTVGLQEVGLEKHVKQVSSDALHSVVNGEDVDPLAILHVRESSHTVGAEHGGERERVASIQ